MIKTNISGTEYSISEIKERMGLNRTWKFSGVEAAPNGNEWGVSFVWEKRGEIDKCYWMPGKIISADRLTEDQRVS